MPCLRLGAAVRTGTGARLRVRWALEEAGLPYRVMLVGDRPGETQRWAQERRPAAVEAVRTDLLEEQPSLVAHEERREARPGFTEALAEQMMAFAT